MIEWLVPWLEEWWSPFRALGYITVRTALAACVAFFLAMVLGKKLVNRLTEVGVRENAGENDSEALAELLRDSGKSRTPTMGGVFWTTAILAGTLLFARPSELLVVLGAMLLVGMGTLGFLDDWVKWKRERNGLPRLPKLVFTLLLAGYVAWMLFAMGERTGRPEVATIYFPVVKDLFASPLHLGAFAAVVFILFEAFVILATTHAVNVTDGLDGLAAGSALIAFVALTLTCYAVGNAEFASYLSLPHIPGAGEVAVMGGAAIGATLGFLWFNCNPAQIFMGDSGSLPMGAFLAYLAIVSKQELALPLLAGVFVLEVSTSLLQILYFKATKGKRLFRIAPIHHAFQLDGIPEQKIVVRFWILGAISAAVGLLLLKVR